MIDFKVLRTIALSAPWFHIHAIKYAIALRPLLHATPLTTFDLHLITDTQHKLPNSSIVSDYVVFRKSATICMYFSLCSTCDM
jgi:hypothetical protein